MTTPNKLFNSIYSYSYDDLILLPNGSSTEPINFTVDQVDLSTKITKNIKLNIPIISSPMDTVTGSKLAIQLALQGGIGILHCNQSIEEQVSELNRVKRFHNGFINDPVCFNPTDPISILIEKQNKCGFTGFPIVDADRKLLGIVSRRDVEFIDKDATDTPISKVMTPNPICTTVNTPLEMCAELIRKNKLSRLPIVDEEGRLIKLVCRKDIKILREHPLANKHHVTKQLMVGAAVTTHPRDRERIDQLCKSQVDLLVIDASNGSTQYQIDTLHYIKSNYSVDVLCGNVVNYSQGKLLVDAGADGLRVGMGIGSICTTQDVCGVGRGQASAVYCISKLEVPIVADGGISNSGQIVKALSLGASAVMLGSMLAGTDEAPGEQIYQDGVRLKKYRGMGSISAMKQRGSQERYLSKNNKVVVAQGVSGTVTSKGRIDQYIPAILKAVKHGFQNLNVQSVQQMQKMHNELLMEIRTPAARQDGSVHHLFSYEHV